MTIRMITLAAAGLATMIAPVAAAQNRKSPVVAVTGGTIAGVRDGKVEAFLGVPYAAPPVGPLRWRDPRPAPRWSGPRDARDFAADCAQQLFPGDAAPLGTQPSEDCLYLNVWRPTGAAPTRKLPVMVWLHGGGFVNGGSSAPVYSGAPFARDGVIMVSLNYRLGRFGFFAHPALEGEGGGGGNFAFNDQIAALRWVKANIAAFGGDPANVTLFGESAGGISVHVLMTSPLARGLFAKAIVQSGAGRGLTDPTHIPSFTEALIAGQKFSAPLGRIVSAAQLRALPADRVIKGLNMATMDVADYAGPMIDNRTVMEAPIDAYRAGRGAAVPLLIGTNSMDGLPFGPDKELLFAGFGREAATARRLYDPRGDRASPAVATDLFADRYMNEPTRAVARLLAPRQPVWLYRFDYVATAMRQEWAGAPHASEIPYAFDTVQVRYGTSTTPADLAVGALMHRNWIAFARSGEKALSRLGWDRYAPGSSSLNLIDAQGRRLAADPLRARLDFIESTRK
ncbi:carboxylesterase/lipase family protein [Sphingomonas hylomeconis]|uniref:Carboxylic ester hydrolase n=1 Tax=Sphingomonas hylomeconis TaxID=1395958 RepID=A0ABV7SXU9_9SPHN|nr:carboxylesterase family protein [Sphingomonas hylomeconis]